jgi:hypothetical protein
MPLQQRPAARTGCSDSNICGICRAVVRICVSEENFTGRLQRLPLNDVWLSRSPAKALIALVLLPAERVLAIFSRPPCSPITRA